MENASNRHGEKVLDVGVEHTEKFDFKKEVFLLMEEQKGKIITYLESEEAKARIAKYIDTYALGLSTEKISIQHAIKRAIENVKSLKYQVGRIGDNASIGIIFGNFDIKKNLITINDSYLNEEGKLTRYDATSFAKNKEQITLAVVHELRHATRLDNHSASEDIIVRNFNRALGLQNVLTHGDQLHGQFLEMRMHDTKKEMEAQKVDGETIQKKLDEIRTSSEFEKGMMRISTRNKYESDVMQPFELYARVKQLEAYMSSRGLEYTKENIILLTKEVMSRENKIFDGYEQLLIMCQGQEEGLIRMLQELVQSDGKGEQYKNIG